MLSKLPYFLGIVALLIGACTGQEPTGLPQKTAVAEAATTTGRPVATPLLSTPSPTSEPAPRPSPTPAPTLGVGSARTRQEDGMVMVHVPAGSFLMGSLPTDADAYDNEFPQHPVSVDAFWLDRTEVTNAQFRLCVDAGACRPPQAPGSGEGEAHYGQRAFDQYPVIHVTWYQAVAYCNWAGARLPLEKEWAFAARGPETRIYPWGNEFDGLRLNYCDVNCSRPFPDETTDDGYAHTAPVAQYPLGVSWVGALDMLGNVWEWVWDWHDYYPGHPSTEHPSSFPPNTYRLLRGGAWDTSRGHARNAFRNWYLPASWEDSIGFRCAGDTE
jgi:formylglycine-generating enzyme required for sulfatase activity